jgi:hypothetical protein
MYKHVRLTKHKLLNGYGTAIIFIAVIGSPLDQ